MDENFLRDFEMLLDVETTKLNSQTAQDMQRAVSAASARGMLQSSAAVKSVVDVASRTIPIHAQAVFTLLLRTANAYGLAVGKDTREEFGGVVAAKVERERLRLCEMVTSTAPYKSVGKPDFLEPLDRLSALEIQRLDGEINLVAAANERRAKEGTSNGGSTNVFNGPVGLVQTGPGSFGVANQVIDAGARQALQRALEMLVQQLDSDDTDDPTFDRGEINELAIEGQGELSGRNPENQLFWRPRKYRPLSFKPSGCIGARRGDGEASMRIIVE